MSADRDRIVSLDKRRVWHPYTAMQTYREQVDPLVVVEAVGSRLLDADENMLAARARQIRELADAGRISLEDIETLRDASN